MKKSLYIIVGLVLSVVPVLGLQPPAHASCTQVAERLPCVESVVCEVSNKVLNRPCID